MELNELTNEIDSRYHYTLMGENVMAFLTKLKSRQAKKSAVGVVNAKKAYTNGKDYTKVKAGITHDAQGRELQLYRQALITRTANPAADPNNNAFRIAYNQGKNPARPDPYKYHVKYDKGWDAYNKAMSEMRHRVASGETNRRKAELKAKANPFLAGQAQRVAASQKAKQKRAGTLISGSNKFTV